MRFTLDLTGTELTLLYLTTGNEDAGRIVLAAAREHAAHNPPAKKPRGRKKGETNGEA